MYTTCFYTISALDDINTKLKLLIRGDKFEKAFTLLTPYNTTSTSWCCLFKLMISDSCLSMGISPKLYNCLPNRPYYFGA